MYAQKMPLKLHRNEIARKRIDEFFDLKERIRKTTGNEWSNLQAKYNAALYDQDFWSVVNSELDRQEKPLDLLNLGIVVTAMVGVVSYMCLSSSYVNPYPSLHSGFLYTAKLMAAAAGVFAAARAGLGFAKRSIIHKCRHILKVIEYTRHADQEMAVHTGGADL